MYQNKFYIKLGWGKGTKSETEDRCKGRHPAGKAIANKRKKCKCSLWWACRKCWRRGGRCSIQHSCARRSYSFCGWCFASCNSVSAGKRRRGIRRSPCRGDGNRCVNNFSTCRCGELAWNTCCWHRHSRRECGNGSRSSCDGKRTVGIWGLGHQRWRRRRRRRLRLSLRFKPLDCPRLFPILSDS